MGYSCGFYTFPKYKGTQISTGTLDKLTKYFNFDTDWVKQHYSNALEYAELEDTEEVKDMIEYYKPFVKPSSLFSNTITTDIDTWYSDSSEWYDTIRLLGTPAEFEGEVTFDQKQLIHLVATIHDILDTYKPDIYTFSKCFKEKYIPEDDDVEITLSKCDGIEVEDLNGNTKRVYGDEIYLATDFNESLVCLQSIFDCLIKILDTVDFETDTVLFSGGW